MADKKKKQKKNKKKKTKKNILKAQLFTIFL